MKLELSHLLALLAIYADYTKLGAHPTTTQYLALATRAIQTLTEAGLTFADLTTLLEAVGPLLAKD